MAKSFLGIDIGTSAVKVLALSDSGATIAKARRSYATSAPDIGWAEQSAEDWWAGTVEALAEVYAFLGGTSVGGIGLSGQLNGFVLIDEAGAPLQNAIIWLDRRATSEADELAATCGREIEAVSGNRVSPIAVMPKLLWMKRHRPDVLAKTKRLLLVKDYILWHLTGIHATDPSDASATNLMDLAKRAWSVDFCRAAGTDLNVLPRIMSSTDVAGVVTKQASKAIGFAEGVPVVPGGGDVAALALGCGVVSGGVLGVTLGTAGHVVLSSAKPLPRVGKGMWQIAHMAEEQIIWLGLIMAGGLSLSWIHRVMSLGKSEPSFEDFIGLADVVEPGARGLIFLPFLEGAATPYEQPSARASFIGLTSSHGAADMIQSVMEGVAFNLRQCVELFESMGATVREVRLAEGGSKVGRWCQIIADVLGWPVNLIEESDTSALGAAMAAVSGVTSAPLSRIAGNMVRTRRRFEPSPAKAAYEQAYANYRKAAALNVQP